MTEHPQLTEAASASTPVFLFGPQFFKQVLPDRVRAACAGHPERVPAVELHLADGPTLDLCHVPTVEPAWFAATVFRDHQTCEDMDLVFVPYTMVMRVTILLWPRSQRPAGFALPPSPAEVRP